MVSNVTNRLILGIASILVLVALPIVANAQVADSQNNITINNNVGSSSYMGMSEEQFNQYLDYQTIKCAQRMKIDKACLWTGAGITTAGVLIDTYMLCFTEGYSCEMNDSFTETMIPAGWALTASGAVLTGISAICFIHHKNKANRITMARNGMGINILF